MNKQNRGSNLKGKPAKNSVVKSGESCCPKNSVAMKGRKEGFGGIRSGKGSAKNSSV